jgi:hypothetical protein
VVWKGGFSVRTDKNNFIAEMAAAATVINAVPKDIDCTMWIDSTATIHALQKGVLLSERKRIRSAGRIWLNWARPRLPSHIKMQHVRSHTNGRDPKEIGNEAADFLANQFRAHGKRTDAEPPCLKWEDPFYVVANNCVVQGDIRAWSKGNEQKELLKSWSERCPSQFRWMKRNRSQILRMAEEVWNWAIENGEGEAWIYFIFAVCDWLPTGRRMGKRNTRKQGQADQESRFRQICQLCLSGEVEDLEHLMHCPALHNELLQMNETVKRSMNKWGLLPGRLVPEGERIADRWVMKARIHFAEQGVNTADDRLRQLARAWVNKGDMRGYSKFERAVEDRLSLLQCKCVRVQSYPSRCGPSLPKDLLEIFVSELSLAVDGMVDALHLVDELFEEWWSNDSVDEQFGAKTDFFKQSAVGRNVFLNPPLDDEKMARKIIEKMKLELTHEAPTRFLLVIPRTLDRGSPYIKAQESDFLEIARFARNSFAFTSPESSHTKQGAPEIEVSIFLGINKESLSRDPIDWQNLSQKVSTWAEKNGSTESLTIPEHTHNLFRERKRPENKSRVSAKQRTLNNAASLFRFFNGNEGEHLHPIGTEFGGLYKKINKWPKALGFLGLLPTPFRDLVKRTSGDPLAHKQISKTIFFAGYRVWKARARLVREILASTPLSFQKIECKNPFHYLKRIANFSAARMTPCRCSLKFVQESKNLDLRLFFPSLSKKPKTTHSIEVPQQTGSCEAVTYVRDMDDLMIYAGDWGVPYIEESDEHSPSRKEEAKSEKQKSERKICVDPPDHDEKIGQLGTAMSEISIIPQTPTDISGLDHKHTKGTGESQNDQTVSLLTEQELSIIEMPSMSVEELSLYEEATDTREPDLALLESLARPPPGITELSELLHILHQEQVPVEDKRQESFPEALSPPEDYPHVQRKSRKKRKKIKVINNNKKRKKMKK